MSDATYAERAEQFLIDMMRERYQVGAGLKNELQLAPIFSRYAELFAEPSVRAHLDASSLQAESAAGDSVRSSPGQVNAAKQACHLADFAVGGYIASAVKELTESIKNAELKATVPWQDQEIPYQNVRAVLVRERDYRRRHDLYQRQMDVMVRQNPQRTERVKAHHDLAHKLGFASYRAMIEQIRGWDLPILAKALGSLISETDAVFEEKLGEQLTDARVPRREADESDVAFVLRASLYDSLFPSERLVPALHQTMAAVGMPIESTPGLRLDTEPRPLKSPRAFCVAVRVPHEVYLVIKPIGGQEDYRALFHESGHAEHFTHMEPSLPFAFRYLGDEAISETFAFLFEHLMLTPRWLVDVLKLPLREAESYQRFALFNKLWLVRRYTAKLRYEIILHDEGPNGVDTAYREILGDVLHIRIHPERYLDDVDDAFYVAGYLRAWIFERQLELYLLGQFGEGWYESREAGSLLRSMWSIGLRDPVDELARTRIGAKGLDPKPLIEELADF